jgi:hypothetical protein
MAVSAIHSFPSDLWMDAGTPWGQVVDTRRHNVDDGRPAGDERPSPARGRAVDDPWMVDTAPWKHTGVIAPPVEDVHRRPHLVHGREPALTCDDAASSTVPQALRV